MLVDSHCHLDFPDFAPDLERVIERAREAGVGAIQTISTRLSTFDGVLAIARRFEGVSCSVGVHPHHAESEGVVEAARIAALATPVEVIGIGETGLDFHYQHSPRELQEASFRQHIAAARSTGLPLIVHSRAADHATMAILEDEMAKGAFTGLIHCFSASQELARRSLAIGFFISVAGIATFRNAEALRRIVATVPLERLLVETDAPFLAPVPWRGKRNEPAFVARTAALLAELKGVSEQRFAAATTQNFFNLFTKADRTTH